MDNMGERIRQRRKELNMTQTELGEKLGIKASAVAKYESGRVENIKKSNISKLAAALETTPAYLFGWDEEEPYQNSKFYELDTHAIPLLGNIACGEPIYADEVEYTMLKDAPVDADFALICNGDSMINAGVKDGDLVFIRKQSTVNNGEIAAVIIEDEATLKHVHYDAENQILTLIPDNPSYQPMIFTGEKLSQVRILGKAVAYVSYFK